MKIHRKQATAHMKKQIWKWILLCYGMITLTNMGMFFILDQFISLNSLPKDFIRISVLYAAAIAVIETVLIYFTVKKHLLMPINDLSEAAEKVAEGDFSVYVDPPFTPGRYSPVRALVENFNAMVDDLSSLETMKSDFISNVSHEIRTPLGNIKNYAAALKSQDLSPQKQAEYIDTIMEASDKLNTMVTNILKLNKLENQIIQPKIEQYDLCEQLSECVLAFETAWTEKNIDIEFDTEDRRIVGADRELLSIVWSNLMSNAVKFTEANGKISIVQRSNAEAVTVMIRDNGCGMDVETQNQIYDKFYQGDTSHSCEGNGLGMALVIRIIRLISGDITVDSELGKGTTVTIKIKKQ